MTGPESSGFRLRGMTSCDLEAVIALAQEVDAAPQWSAEEYQSLMKSSEPTFFRRIMLVAELGERLAGFVVARVVADIAELESIVVADRKRGQGIGWALLMEFFQRARACGAGRVELEVRASNAAAGRLYLRAGFRETGRRRAYYRDPKEDGVLMSCTL